MGIRVLEIHHHAVRIDSDPPKLDAVQRFYQDVLGLEADPGRPTIPEVPGFWINVGQGGQIHLIGGKQPSPLAKGPGQDPTIPHVALAVADIQETKAELDRLNVPYWSMTGINGPVAEQIFINDPSGNMVELHQSISVAVVLAIGANPASTGARPHSRPSEVAAFPSREDSHMTPRSKSGDPVQPILELQHRWVGHRSSSEPLSGGSR